MKEPVSGAFGARADGPAEAIVGSSIGPWKLLRHIGTGGTASVYAAARSERGGAICCAAAAISFASR